MSSCHNAIADGLVLADSALPSITVARGDLWMLAGFVLLGWVLARTTIRRRRRIHAAERENREMESRLQNERQTAAPLSDAPPETQRWQVAMFELQRELKGELDSRIAVVQGLTHRLEERIAAAEKLQHQLDEQLTQFK